MKKLMVFLLALAMVFPLCACGRNPYAKYEKLFQMLENGNFDGAISVIEQMKDNPDAGQSSGNKPSGMPTDEEMKRIMQYNSICDFLQGGEENMGYGVYVQETDRTLYDQDALRFCYETLNELEAVDKWIGTAHAYQGGLSRQELLAGFTMVKDVLLTIESTGKDQMGNTFKNEPGSWDYYENGLIRRREDNHPIRHLYADSYYEWIYDENGRLLKKEYRSGDVLNSLITYFYDAEGKITKEVFKSNSGETEYLYTYDEKGQLAKIVWDGLYMEDTYIQYTYDDAGRLLQEYKCFDLGEYSAMDYIYDAQGKLVSATYSSNGYGKWTEDQYEYTCDEKGRVLTCKITFGETKNDAGEVIGKPEAVYVIHTYVYGNYYFYDFAK